MVAEKVTKGRDDFLRYLKSFKKRITLNLLNYNITPISMLAVLENESCICFTHVSND